MWKSRFRAKSCPHLTYLIQKWISNFFLCPNRPKKSFVWTLPMGSCEQALEGQSRWSLTRACSLGEGFLGARMIYGTRHNLWVDTILERAERVSTGCTTLGVRARQQLLHQVCKGAAYASIPSAFISIQFRLQCILLDISAISDLWVNCLLCEWCHMMISVNLPSWMKCRGGCLYEICVMIVVYRLPTVCRLAQQSNNRPDMASPFVPEWAQEM